MDIIKGVIDKVASRKLAVTAAGAAAAGAAAAAKRVVDITLPVAIVAVAYVIGQSTAGGRSDSDPDS
jgi:hypothetical protein